MSTKNSPSRNKKTNRRKSLIQGEGSDFKVEIKRQINNIKATTRESEDKALQR